jgi:hypothetical protein
MLFKDWRLIWQWCLKDEGGFNWCVELYLDPKTNEIKVIDEVAIFESKQREFEEWRESCKPENVRKRCPLRLTEEEAFGAL